MLIPLLFMGGVIGRLFSEFAVTLAVTIVISGVVSLTLVPMLCARLLRAKGDHLATPKLVSSRSVKSFSTRLWRLMSAALRVRPWRARP